MTMKLSILLSANAKEAKAEIAAVENALAKMGKTSGSTDTAAKGLSKTTTTLDAAVGKAKREVQQLSAAEVRNAATAGKMGAANGLAAGQVANLTAQFNDIGVMLAAGQNPLQLAIQQGTQITQVIGPMGAAGAATALKSALLSMFNPLSLITLGTIAGGAALIQWATSASDASTDAEELAEKLIAAKEAQAGLTQELRQAAFGASAEELTLIDAIAIRKAEVLELEEKIAFMRATGATARGDTGYGEDLQAARVQLEQLQMQLAEIRRLQSEKERLAASTVEMANAERLLGEQMRQSGTELAANERIAELLRAGISASVIEAMQLAGVDMASPISSAAGEAATLATNLGIAYGEAVKLNYERSKSYVSSGRGGDPRDFEAGGREASRYVPSAEAVRGANKLLNPPAPRSPGGGRSAISAIEREQKAIDDLISSLEEQRDVIGETDPVQKEMIQNRKVLAAATDAERKTVEQLIAARIAEQAAVDSATQRAEFYGDVMSSALDEATRKGASLDDVLKNIASSFIDAGIQAAIFGEGPFGSLFGGTSLLDLIFPQKKAEGGMIYGAGGGREDKVPLWGSAGEFVVNASATARNRALLERINAGAPVQALAAGGMVGDSRGIAATGAGGNQAPVSINVDVTGARGNTEIMEAVREGIRQGLQEYDREVLPGRVSEISGNPRMVG